MYLTTTMIRNGTVSTLSTGCGSWPCVTGGPSYSWSSITLTNPLTYIDSSGWGLQVGDIINFHMLAQINPLHRGSLDYQVTVEPPPSHPTSMTPPSPSDSLMAGRAPASLKAEAVTIRKEDVEELLGLNERSLA
jgi:hypothetical protein